MLSDLNCSNYTNFSWNLSEPEILFSGILVSSESISMQLKTSLEPRSEQNKFKFYAWQKMLTNFPIDLCEDMFISGNWSSEK